MSAVLSIAMEVLATLFEQHFKTPARRVQPVQGDLGGSGRRIVRIFGDGISAIGVLHNVREENVAFIEFSRHFRRHGLPVPEILAEDLSQGAYIEEDLGDTTLFQMLAKNRDGETILPAAAAAYRASIEMLPRFQIEAGSDLNYKVCYPRNSFDKQSIAWDLNYFKYYFLKLAGIPFSEQALEDDFARLTKFLLSADHGYFLYRDFQSRNIMLREGRPYFLDYQGGRRGALQYDVASLLYDAKADLSTSFRQELLDCYLRALPRFTAMTRERFMEHYYAYVYVRIMQAMGAYGFRGFFERKTHFLQSVPYALQNLNWLLKHAELPIRLTALTDAFRRMVDSERLRQLTPASGTAAGLVVRVFSFSFHRGFPKDESGHGGGFVFDCRALPNPGRDPSLASLTGRDAAVIERLEGEEGVHQFLAGAIALVDASVSAYQRRGFRSLMVSFGCTGGRHRSVFMAERLGKHLLGKAQVEVLVRHLGLEESAG